MNNKQTIKMRFFSAPTATGLCGARRAAVMLLATMMLTMTAQTAWATTITPSAPSQDADGFYSIGTAAELYGFAEIVNSGNAAVNAKLTADIVVNENVLDINGDANTGDFVQWIPIGNHDDSKTYSGTFDGQGHTISGLYVSITESGKGFRVGVIGTVSGSATIKNLGIVDSYFGSSDNFLGSIVGYIDNGSSVTLANVYSTSTVKGVNWIGGLVGGDGQGSVSVINSYFAGKTSAQWTQGHGTHYDDLVAGDFDLPISGTLDVCNAFVLGTSQYGTSVTAEQLSDGTVAAALHYYQDALADGSVFGISDGKTTFSGSLDGVSVTTADITLHTFDGDATAYSSKYIVGNTTPLPVNVEREGYTFLGWYDNADLEGDAVTSISSSESGSKEYWAKFVRSHSVTFVLNDGTIQKGEIDHYIEGETTALPSMVFKNGASFEGWYAEDDFSGSRYYSIPSTATEDMTFYAKWGEAKATFYLTQGGSPEPVNVLYEGENVVYLDKTTMDGYYVQDENGNCWGGFESSINVPYTGGESTFGNGGRAFNVAQSGFYVFTLTAKDEGKWFVSVLRSMQNCTVADIADQTYTGQAIEPEVTVTDGETTLTLGTDYTVTCSDINTGTATATINGAGNYSGQTTATFKIVPKPVTDANIANTGSGAPIALTQDQNGTTATLDGASDGSVSITADVAVADVKLSRTIENGKKMAVCWPFVVTASEASALGTFYEFKGIDTDGKIEMQAVSGDLAANTPYIFEPNGDKTEIDFGAKTLKAGGPVQVGNGYTYKGIYSRVKWTTDTNDPLYNADMAGELGKAYGFALEEITVGETTYHKGQFVKLGSGAHSRAFRAYLLYDGTWDGNEPSAAARRATRGEEGLPDVIDIVWLGASGSTTGIADCKSAAHDSGIANSLEQDAWYSMDGRRLSGKPSAKGVYINNGRKVVIK